MSFSVLLKYGDRYGAKQENACTSDTLSLTGYYLLFKRVKKSK